MDSHCGDAGYAFRYQPDLTKSPSRRRTGQADSRSRCLTGRRDPLLSDWRCWGQNSHHARSDWPLPVPPVRRRVRPVLPWSVGGADGDVERSEGLTEARQRLVHGRHPPDPPAEKEADTGPAADRESRVISRLYPVLNRRATSTMSVKHSSL